MGRNDSLTIEEQLADVNDGLAAAREMAEDGSELGKELDRTHAVLRQIETRSDPRLVTLREIFSRDEYEVEHASMPGEDYKITISGGHFRSSKKELLKLLGFDQGSTHTSVLDGDDTVELHVYVRDGGD